MKKEGLFAAGWVILAFCIGIFLVARESGSNVQSIYYGRLPDFHLTDYLGNDFDYEDIIGRIWVVKFSNSVETEFPDLPSEIETLTILTYLPTVSIFNYKSTVVFGKQKIITQLATDGFHLTEEMISKTDYNPLILLDKSGNIRGYYNPEREKDIKKLGRDIDSLLQFS